jgi:hypothetical protein
MKSAIKPTLAMAGAFLSTVLLTRAETLLYKDNFDTADTTNLDAAPLTGRLTGSLAATVFPRSAKILQEISANQLLMHSSPATGRVRFQNAAGWHDWASGSEGASILTAGGMRVQFDLTPPVTTNDSWIAFDIGHNAATAGEPDFRVVDGGTDYGILIRNNGNSVRFDGGASVGNGTAFNPLPAPQHVVIDFAFTSFADGSNVVAKTTVGGTLIATDNFTWDGNAGAIFMELETNQNGALIDNFSVSTVPAEFDVALTPTSFVSGVAQGEYLGALTGSTLLGGPESSTFTFVSGPGSTDNGKFQIVDDQLIAGSYNFKQDAGGTQYAIRIQGTGSATSRVGQQAFVLTLIKDDDNDTILDAWELSFTGNLTDLNGLAFGPGPGAGTGDFDNDGIPDPDEYNLSKTTYPGISPILADTDGDTLNDNDELSGAGSRPPTSPVRADTDGDGLSDKLETNTGTFVSATDTGSSPTVVDTDIDGARDGFEVLNESNPVDNAFRPALPPGFALLPLTDDASTGISITKTYTHAISGGAAATINGVQFSELSPTVTPENFSWDVEAAGTKAVIAAANNNAWIPANGGVTGPGLLSLLGTFTYGFLGQGPQGVSQSYVLSGLTPGVTYQTKIYIRSWAVDGNGRPLDLVFANGATVVQPFGALLADRPDIVLNNGNVDSAYCLAYTFVAEGTALVINANVPATSAGSGSLHLYGLSNEVAPSAGGELKITSFSPNGVGGYLINFRGAANTTYKVMKSPDLVTPFQPLTIPINVTTDAGGLGSATVPVSEASESREFYRIEK